jgi:hypothetical protein
MRILLCRPLNQELSNPHCLLFLSLLNSYTLVVSVQRVTVRRKSARPCAILIAVLGWNLWSDKVLSDYRNFGCSVFRIENLSDWNITVNTHVLSLLCPHQLATVVCHRATNNMVPTCIHAYYCSEIIFGQVAPDYGFSYRLQDKFLCSLYCSTRT